MKKLALVASLLTFLVSTVIAKESETILAQEILTEDQTYRHASEIVAAINRKDWDVIPRGKGYFIEILEPNAESKNWLGVGAYRGTEKQVEKSDEWSLKHRFGYETNLGPHELWVMYLKIDDEYKFERVMILGW